MANRKITTIFAIEGEDAYRKKVAEINSTLSSLRAELGQVTTNFAANANSMEALRAKGEALNKLHAAQAERLQQTSAALANAREAQEKHAKALEECRAKVAATEERLQAMSAASGASSAAVAGLTGQLEQYRAELTKEERCYELASQGVATWERRLGTAQRQLTKTGRDINTNNRLLDEAARSADGCASSIDQYGRRVREAGQKSKEASDGIGTLAAALTAAGAAKGLTVTKDAIEDCIDASIRLESAMAGVRRTVGGSEEEIAELAAQFKGLSSTIPLSTAAMGKIAETAGQLGVARDKVVEFTTVMAKLATTTDLTAETAATMLAQFSNITGQDDFERLGSVVASLGDSTATTASKVVEMSQGMAATASVAGMAETDILGIAAAVGSLGMESQAGSTAMSTLISTLHKSVETGSDKLELFARTANMTAEQFSAAWRRDAAGALSAFVAGLNDVQRNGRSAIVILDELGISNARQIKAIQGLSQAGDLLSDTIRQANRAWEENTALNAKSAIMYETTESKLAMAKNAAENLKAAIGDALTPALGELAERGTDAFSWAADFAERSPWLVQAITGAVGAVALLSAGVTGYTVVAKAAKVVQDQLNLSMSLCPAVAIAAALGALLVPLAGFASSAKGAQSEMDRLNASMTASSKAYQDTAAALRNQRQDLEALISTLEGLAGTEHKTSAQKSAMLSLVEQLNEAIPGLDLAYNELDGTLTRTTEDIRAMAAAMADQAEQDAAAKRLAELYQEQTALTDELRKAREELAGVEQALAEATEKQRQATRENWEVANGYTAQIEQLGQELFACQQRVEDCKIALAENSIAIDDVAGHTEAYKATLEGLTRSIQRQTEATDEQVLAAMNAADGLSRFKIILDDVKGGYTFLAEAQEEARKKGVLSSDTLDRLLDKYPDLERYLVATAEGYTLTEGALQDYITAQRAQYELSLGSAERAAETLVRSEAAKAAGFEATTGSIKAQIQALAQLYAIKAEEARGNVLAKYGNDVIGRQLASKDETVRQYDGLFIQAENALLSIQKAETALGEFDRVISTLGKEQTSGTSKRTDKKDAKDERLEAYKAALDELDYLRDTDAISEAGYYARLEELRDTYLEKNSDEWRRATVELYNWRRGRNEAAYDEELADQQYFLNMGLINEETYYQRMAALRDQYLEEDSEKRRAADVAIYQYQQRCREEHLKALETEGKERLKSLEAGLKEQEQALKEAYSQQKAALKEAYEAQAKERKSAYDAEKKSLKANYDAQKSAAKAAYEEKRSLIQAELKLEQERLNAVLEGIDKEIQARRELREDEDQDDAIARAKKRLEAAKAEMAYARTDDDRAEWEKEVLRRQEELDKAVQAKDDTQFYREKAAEKEAVQREIEEVKAKADAALEQLSAEYTATKERLEAAYAASTERLESEYTAAKERLEADYNAALTRAETAYNEAVTRASEAYNAAVERLEGEYAAAGVRLEASYKDVTARSEEAYGAAKERLEGEYDTSTARSASEYGAAVSRLEAEYAATVKRLEDAYSAALSRLASSPAASGSSGGGGGGGGRSSGSSGGGGGGGSKSYSADVQSIAKAQGVSLDIAQNMYDANQRNAGDPSKPYYAGSPPEPEASKDPGGSRYSSAAAIASTAAEKAAAKTAAAVVARSSSSVTNHNSASITVNSGSAPTEGQLARTVEKVLGRLGKK